MGDDMHQGKEHAGKQHKINVQSLLVALCIFAVCVGTQQIQTTAWNSGIIEFSRDALGVLMAVIIGTNYHWSEIKKYKLPYIIWTVAAGIGGMIAIPIAFNRRVAFLKADTVVIWLGVLFMGYCVIHTFLAITAEKYRPKFYKPLFVIWMVMMLLMIVSRSRYLWPECYFVLFLTFYLTKQTSEQRTNTIKGMIHGIVLAFIVIQGHSLLCRPYDKLRYRGNFCNPNHNCMFLCMCLAAILGSILYSFQEKASKIVKVFYFILAGACYSFIFMTMCRSGYLATFVVTVFFLIACCRLKKKHIFIRMGLLMTLLFVVMLPVTYLAVRYIPTIHPHVLFYFQEGYSEQWVHPWDERDSEKYISFEEMMQGVFGRWNHIKDAWQDLFGLESKKSELQDLRLASNVEKIPRWNLLLATGNMLPLETSTDKVPVLTLEEATNSLKVRYTIYKWFITHLSFRGMPYEDQGFQLTSYYWVQEAHSIYLYYGINFGIPVMILFAVFIWWGIGRLIKQGHRGKNVEKLCCLLILLVPPVFGLFEMSWGVSLISTVAFYLSFRAIIEKE